MKNALNVIDKVEATIHHSQSLKQLTNILEKCKKVLQSFAGRDKLQ